MDNSLTNLSPAELAAKCINQTNKPVFLTGKAGTGKTTFLRNIIEHTHKNAIIVAPTGIAAINAGGVTIHSQFGIPFGLFIPDSSYKIDNTNTKINTPYTMVKHLNMRDQKRKLLQDLELLIIDEVSMLRADLLDTIDFVLRSIRRQQHKPFGGVQLLFIGDLMQLPPVIKEEEWSVLRHYYNSIYFFDAHVLRNEKPVYIELDKIYRQNDNTFIDLLNNLRNNKVTQANIDLLNSYYKPNFDVSSALNIITLTTHNQKADTLNKSALMELKGKSYFFSADIEGEFNEYAYPVEAYLELKVGAQIMFIKNDISGKQQFFNGKIGVVSHLSDKEIEIDFKDGTKPFVLEKYEWKNIKYELNEVTNEIEENTIGTFTQYPIKLAWAITVHKSQGLTFEKAILDINRAFAPGQVYVALSRLKSLDGLVLTSPIQFNAISQDKTLVDYTENKPKTEEVTKLINQETLLFFKGYVLKAYDFVWLYTCLKNHVSSYTMVENKSNKQKHQVWAQELLDKFEPLKINADKFCNQLMQIFESRAEDYLQTVQTRHIAAKNYFYPILKDLSKSILVHIELLKDEKQIKTYLEELLELEGLFYKHLQLLDKVSTVIDNVLNNKEFNKHQLKQTANQNERLELVRQTIEITEKAAFEERKTKKSATKKTKKEKVLKEPKPDTKEISFSLYKQGKMPEEIALERGFGLTTIETHLAHYVSLGMIPVTQFVSKEKFDKIIETSKHIEGDAKLTPIKEALGDDYSYSEIKYSLATQKYLKK
ncbi:MAG TPA: helix-turn-helix domain-containing protein [Bacteroidia bacterium]|nr:helix-turn-helix domain-containing protein [Bacteroidia bacterium]